MSVSPVATAHTHARTKHAHSYIAIACGIAVQTPSTPLILTHALVLSLGLFGCRVTLKRSTCGLLTVCPPTCLFTCLQYLFLSGAAWMSMVAVMVLTLTGATGFSQAKHDGALQASLTLTQF